MTSLANIITFLWLSYWAIDALKRLRNGSKASINVVMLVFFLFCGFPLLLDILIRRPYYDLMPGFTMATEDDTTNYIYCLFVAMVPIFWRLLAVRFAVTANQGLTDQATSLDKMYALSPRLIARIVLYAVLVSPIFLAWRSPDYLQYMTYSHVLRYSLYGDIGEWHTYVALFTFLSVLSGTYLVLNSKRKIGDLVNCLTIYPFIIISFWINGKRAILALAIFLIILVGWIKDELKGRSLIYALIVGVLILSVLSFSYQIKTGRVADSDFYDDVRIDFGRDHGIKMAIFSEINSRQLQVLEYRGQSILFYAAMIVPRELWPQKPLPYANYVTSAALLTEPRDWGWGLTTSILDEAIANLGWWGLLGGPLLVIILCLAGDRSRSLFVRLLTPVIATLFLTVQLIAFVPLLALWLGALSVSALQGRDEGSVLRSPRESFTRLDASRQF